MQTQHYNPEYGQVNVQPVTTKAEYKSFCTQKHFYWNTHLQKNTYTKPWTMKIAKKPSQLSTTNSITRFIVQH